MLTFFKSLFSQPSKFQRELLQIVEKDLLTSKNTIATLQEEVNGYAKSLAFYKDQNARLLQSRSIAVKDNDALAAKLGESIVKGAQYLQDAENLKAHTENLVDRVSAYYDENVGLKAELAKHAKKKTKTKKSTRK